LVVIDLWVFSHSYWIANDIKESRWEHVYDAAGFDENGYDAEGYNGLGCNEAGEDHDGNPCSGDSTESSVGY
jgi:hypothetical protein